MKKVCIIGVSILSIAILSSCSSKTNSKNKTNDKKIEKKDVFLNIKNGVDDGKIIGDSQNYANISGTSKTDNEVFLIDAESGLAHGMSKVENGKFNISCNMQGAGQIKVYLTNDKGLKLYGNDVSKLKNKIPLIFIPNENASNKNNSENESNEDSSTKNEDIFKIGEAAKFQSGLSITINSIENSSEEPNEELEGHLVKVTFTVENNTGSSIDFNSHSIDLYDSQSLKTILNSKSFYSENIANGMKSTGAAYYDSKNEGPYTVIVGAATFKQ